MANEFQALTSLKLTPPMVIVALCAVYQSFRPPNAFGAVTLYPLVLICFVWVY